MPVSAARTAAFDILLRIEQQDAYASELLHASQYSNLSSVDHGLATELVMGVLRWRSLFDEQISHFSSKPVEKLDLEVLTALRLGAYQLTSLDRVPERAAVHESVELVKRARKKSAVPFANAVLRRLAASASAARSAGENGAVCAALDWCFAQNAKPSFSDSVQPAVELSQKLAHPRWLVERWAREFDLDAARQICCYDQRAPDVAVRISDPRVEAELRQDGIELAPGELLASAWRVRAGNVSATRAFAEGRVAIQDEASQLVGLLAGKGSKILDCCAAPGGKTRVLAEQNPDSSIMALELHPHRARLLRKLVPAKNVEVINSDVRQFTSSASFDRVLVDVPCSGTGTLARNPEIKWRLKPEDLTDLHSRQWEILQAAMRLVAPGGRLVYSTCSLEREENEQVVEAALAGEPLRSSFHLLDCRMELERLRKDGHLAWENIDSLLSGQFVRTIPGVHPCDGFFVAILQRMGP
jgi:16S rRNA (cytosine967-C5)-methyltransferase